MLQNAYFLANIGADAAENEQHFAEILPKTGAAACAAGPPAAGIDGHCWASCAPGGSVRGERANFTRLVLGWLAGW